MPRTADPWDDWENEDYSRAPAAQPAPASSQRVASASDNARLWNVANSSLSFGPQTVHATAPASAYSYAGNANPVVPPPQAFMPSLKILKRPTGTPNGARSSATSPGADKQAMSLKEREKAYAEARKKIFGDAALAASSSNPASVASSAENSDSDSTKNRRRKPDTNPNATTIIREPVNPPSSSGNKTAKDLQKEKGFNTARRSKPKKPLSAAAAEFTPGSFAKKAVPKASPAADELAQKASSLSLTPPANSPASTKPTVSTPV